MPNVEPDLQQAKQDLGSLEAKLKIARETSTIAPPASKNSHHSAYGLGMKMAVELAAGLGFGVIIGYAIDTQFNSKPIGILIGAVLGIVGGFWNMLRLSKKS